MLNVLHVINSLKIGGAETLLVNSLAENGLQSHINNVLVYLQGTSVLEQKVDPAVKIICLNYKGIRDIPRIIMKLRKIVKKYKIDIVHSHLNPAGTYTGLALPKNVKQVHTLHTLYSADTQTRNLLLQLEKQILFNNKETSLIFLSEFLKKDFHTHIKFHGNSFVLNNFINDVFFDSFERKENEHFKVIAVGNLKPVKNYNYLFQIFQHLKDVPISLDIYGEGEIDIYKRMIDEGNLNIKLMGSHSKIHEVLPGYNLFIMASKFEGYPIAVLEAMACGVPCMLSNIATLKDIAGDNAVYFDLDNAEAAANTIKQIINRKIDVQNLAKEGKNYALKANRKIYIEKLLNIYDKVQKA